MVFLKWQQNGTVSYEEIRDCIVVACRMMGYDEEDVEEYLLNSFEELIWEWGYLALIVGK
ncbi:MAG: flagellin lysine-N-methylase, partial [Lachnospiraceae bacterium]|nr:flagellin lysine-N-methylase [Lachnospiraceae bacterium]